ncbi:MAG: transporter [Fimbriimonadaceae bacterium]
MSLLFISASAMAVAQARSPIATDRPGFSDGSNLVGAGVLQFESGFFRTVVGSSVTTSLGDGLLRYGINERFEVRLIGISYGFAPGIEQWLEPSIGFKARIVQSPRGELTFIGQTTVPVGSGALRTNEWNPTFKVAATAPLGRDTVGGNLAYARLGSGNSRFDQFALSAFVARPLTTKSALTGEVWVVDQISRGGPAAGYISLAITHLLNNDQQLDLRIGTGFNQGRDGWILQGGFSVRF